MDFPASDVSGGYPLWLLKQPPFLLPKPHPMGAMGHSGADRTSSSRRFWSILCSASRCSRNLTSAGMGARAHILAH